VYIIYHGQWTIEEERNNQTIENNEPPLAIKKKFHPPREYIELDKIDSKTLKNLSYTGYFSA
jgi:hypothetical protein